MKKSDTLVMGVLYPGVEKYTHDYLSSIQAQTDRSFDLLLLNDKAGNEACCNFPKDTIIVNIKGEVTYAEVRLRGISYAIKSKYKYLIFTDVDDYFSKDRIALSKSKLKNYDFVYNEINLVDAKKRTIQDSFLSKIGVRSKYIDYRDLLKRNIFGMTHTAVRLNKLKAVYIPKEIIAVDWWIYTILLLNGSRGYFVKKGRTYYRQSNNNQVGMAMSLDERILFLGIQVKKIHYKNIVDYCSKNNLNQAKCLYQKELGNILKLSNEIKNIKFRKRYIEIINENINKIYNGWWSQILTLKQWRNYA